MQKTGVEPARALRPQDPQSCLSANSNTSAKTTTYDTLEKNPLSRLRLKRKVNMKKSDGTFLLPAVLLGLLVGLTLDKLLLGIFLGIVASIAIDIGINSWWKKN